MGYRGGGGYWSSNYSSYVLYSLRPSVLIRLGICKTSKMQTFDDQMPLQFPSCSVSAIRNILITTALKKKWCLGTRILIQGTRQNCSFTFRNEYIYIHTCTCLYIYIYIYIYICICIFLYTPTHDKAYLTVCPWGVEFNFTP